MKDEEIKMLEEMEKYLEDWLSGLGTANNIAPKVQKNLEQVRWQLEALKNSPEAADEIVTPSMIDDIKRGYGYIKIAFPMIPEFNLSTVTTSGSATTASSSSVFQYVSRVEDIGTPEATAYTAVYTSRYYDQLNSQKRHDEVRGLIQGFCSLSTLGRFDDASGKFYSFKGGVTDEISTANAIRNLLYGIEGDLFERARTHPGENMTWEIMSARLTKTDMGGEEHLINANKSKRSTLIQRLSEVLKGRKGTSATDVEFIWTETIDHIYIILNLIRT